MLETFSSLFETGNIVVDWISLAIYTAAIALARTSSTEYSVKEVDHANFKPGQTCSGVNRSIIQSSLLPDFSHYDGQIG